MQDEKNVESTLESRVGPVLWLGGAKKHVQEIARVAEVVVRINEGHSQRVTVRECRNRRHLADKAISLLLARFNAEDVFRVVIEGGKSRDRGHHHAHRMSIVMKAVQKFLDAFVDEGVMRDVVGPVLELRGGGQFTIQKQIGSFEISALFREIFDRI